MNINDSFVLPDDVTLVPLASLPEDRRAELNGSPDDVVITRSRSRHNSKLVDAAMARLLKNFRSSSTIVEGMIAFSLQERLDPERVLDSAYPIIEQLVRGQWLAPSGTTAANVIGNTTQPGGRIGGYIVESVIQSVEDTELFRVRCPNGYIAALKLARDPSASSVCRTLKREEQLLRAGPTGVTPQHLDGGQVDGRQFLVMEWCSGELVTTYAHRLRREGTAARCDQLNLLRAIAQAYATLHEHGVLHGDVHPGNLILAEGDVRIVDLGLARMPASVNEDLCTAPRGYHSFFVEPEYAAMARDDSPARPQVTELSEQNVLAQVLYHLITGQYYTKVDSEHDMAMMQLSEPRVHSFTEAGVPSWLSLERVLERALHVDPGERYPSVTAFSKALLRIQPPRGLAGDGHERDDERELLEELHREGTELIDDYVGRLSPARELFRQGYPSSPITSVNFGSAGAAMFLYRCATLRDDPRLLSWSKLWIEKSVNETICMGERAFYNPVAQLSREILGRNSVYHTETGVYLVLAQIAAAMGDEACLAAACSSFHKAASLTTEKIDVTLGSAGVLLGCSQLLATNPDAHDVLDLGKQIYNCLLSKVCEMPPIPERQAFNSLGMAHGWAGILYSLLQWTDAGNAAMSAEMVTRLEQLATLAEPTGSGVRWPRSHVPGRAGFSPSGYDASWCNGTAGHLQLWSHVAQMTGHDHWLTLASKAAESVVADTGTVNQICCGQPGGAYALLRLPPLPAKLTPLQPDHSNQGA
jgi:serine/threonine protein kinase